MTHGRDSDAVGVTHRLDSDAVGVADGLDSDAVGVAHGLDSDAVGDAVSGSVAASPGTSPGRWQHASLLTMTCW